LPAEAAFGDRLYVELQRHPARRRDPTAAERRPSEPGLIELAHAHDLPLVATNDVYFPEARHVRGP
jgi:DNA polymerase-3 subunit alpha